MVSELLDGFALFDGLLTGLRWFGDGLFWLVSPIRRSEIRNRWAARGLMYKYAQVLSWFAVFFALSLGILFLLAAFATQPGM